MDCVIKNKETAYIKPEGLLLPDGRVIPNWSEVCEIQQGANVQIFYVENKKEKKHKDKVSKQEIKMEPKQEVVEQVAQPAVEAPKAVVEAPVTAPVAETHAATAEPAAVPFDVNQLTQSAGGGPVVAIALAGMAVLGGGAAMKFYKQFSEQKHEQAMKKLELEAQSQGLNAQNAVVEGRLAAMEAKLASMEKKTSSFSADFDASDLEERIEKLEKKAKTGGRPPKA
jgi:uncharacterized protein HemX